MSELPPPTSYEAARDELRSLLRDLQGDEADLDGMTERVARARQLIDWCRERLRSTEAAVDELLGSATGAVDPE